MLEGVWYGIAAALVFLGLVSVAYIIFLKIFRTDLPENLVVVLSERDDGGDIGSFLYSAHMRLSLWGGGKLVIVDNGLSENQLSLCRRIMNECGGMEMCSAAELADLLTGKEM